MHNFQQPRNDYFESNVPAQRKTSLTLPGGQEGQGPFYYSLGTQSTIPFISLLGGGSTQKVFSWGEMIQVNEGETVTVKSESFHQGDIEIVSGQDYANQPQRITVPVPIIVTGGAGGNIIPAYPLDTRRARNAYVFTLALTAGLPGGGVTTRVSGFAEKHSFNTVQDPGAPNGYFTDIVTPPGTFIGQIPLGFGNGLIPNSPMALMDKARFIINFGADPPALGSTVFLYTLEY